MTIKEFYRKYWFAEETDLDAPQMVHSIPQMLEFAVKWHDEQSRQAAVSGSLPLTEIVYLLRVNQPKNCPNWIEGKGDCGSMVCLACRTQKCIDELECGNDH